MNTENSTASNNVTVTIEKIINECFGLAHLENGKIVFVPKVLTDEIHEVEITDDKKNFCNAKSVKIIKKSPLRIKPKCPYFNQCGGCDLQHVSYEDQIKMKTDIIMQFLEKDNLCDKVQLEIMPSPSCWNYRNTAVFHVRNNKAGFFANQSHDIVPITECPILENGILEKLNDRSKDHSDGEIKIRKDNGGLIVASFDKEKTNAFGVQDQSFHVWIKNFFQANTSLIPLWLEKIAQYAEIQASDEVLDLYSGVGIISLFLAKKALKVTGIEFERSAVKRAIINSWVNSIRNCYFFSGPAEKLISRIKHANKIIMNPPREGADIPAIKIDLKRLSPSLLVYSSCNASTFFRDCAILNDYGYDLTHLTMADMFPQTRHFEIIARFQKK